MELYAWQHEYAERLNRWERSLLTSHAMDAAMRQLTSKSWRNMMADCGRQDNTTRTVSVVGCGGQDNTTRTVSVVGCGGLDNTTRSYDT